MLTVVPFRAGGKSRLPEDMRREIALAMLGDVVEVALTIGEVRVVTDDAAGRLVAGDLGARLIDDPGGGQGPAVGAGLEGADGLCLVVNADLPRVRPSDLNALAVPALLGRLGLVAGGRRDDERPRPPARGRLRRALRPGQRRAVPSACGSARDRVRGARAPEPRR